MHYAPSYLHNLNLIWMKSLEWDGHRYLHPWGFLKISSDHKHILHSNHKDKIFQLFSPSLRRAGSLSPKTYNNTNDREIYQLETVMKGDWEKWFVGKLWSDQNWSYIKRCFDSLISDWTWQVLKGIWEMDSAPGYGQWGRMLSWEEILDFFGQVYGSQGLNKFLANV